MATQFAGGTYISTSQSCTTKWSLMQFLLQQLSTNVTNAGWTNLAMSSGQGPANIGTCTITIASPAVITFTGHGFLGGEQIMFATTGALPTGISANTTYFVKFIDANTFNIATSLGGSNINTSGSQSGTQTVYSKYMLLKSAIQANVTNPIVVKIQDNGSSSVCTSIQNLAATLVGTNSTSGGCYLVPTGTANFQLIATKYWWSCFLIGATGNRKFVMAGMVYVPSFVSSVTDQGFVFGDSQSDGDTTVRTSFRDAPKICSQSQNPTNFQIIWNTNLFDAVGPGNSNNNGYPNILYPNHFTNNGGATGTAWRWDNGDLQSGDVFLVVGLTAFADEPKIKGQFFDMLFIGGAFTIDATDTFNSHNWWNLTNNNSASPVGGIWLATS